MATATPVLYTRHKSKKDGTYPIKIMLNHGKKQSFFNLKHRATEEQWTGAGVNRKHPDPELVNSDIEFYLSKARTYFSDCLRLGRPIKLDFAFTEHKSASMPQYLRHRARQHEKAGQIDMMYKADRYAKELAECFGSEVFFDEVNQDFLRTYEAWLKKGEEGVRKPNNCNTRAKKFEFLGKYYGNAMDEGLAPAPNPFKKYSIAGEEVHKEKLTAEEVKAIEDLQLAPGAVNDARNAWLLAYYVQGVRFENVCRLRWEDIKGERIVITSLVKGGKNLSARIHSRLQQILDYYKPLTGGGAFVFPFITELPTDPKAKRSVIGSRNTVVNRNLKIVAALAEVPKKLSFHISRHTFAQHLKIKGKDIHVIKEALRHSKIATTEKYLAALDDERLDKEMEDLYGE